VEEIAGRSALTIREKRKLEEGELTSFARRAREDSITFELEAIGGDETLFVVENRYEREERERKRRKRISTSILTRINSRKEELTDDIPDSSNSDVDEVSCLPSTIQFEGSRCKWRIGDEIASREWGKDQLL